ncbi:MAG: (deoxy)nucleoside triphosphate pyrophosphohydrolase [Ignavibacteriae bacterium]|nr:(deoxy)nucleoside triphosphate pyrophosphohydrolase [Ignavibacteriota bacterium]
MSTKTVGVSVAIIRRGNEVLLCQRNEKARYALQWEFPGGKIELGETSETALIRELFEELDINAEIGQLLHAEESHYPDGGKFFVHFYLVEKFSNEIQNKVFQTVKWVMPENLLEFQVLEGNVEICRNLPEILKKVIN